MVLKYLIRFCLLSLFSCASSFGQTTPIVNQGILHVGDGGLLYVGNNALTLASTTTTTSRSLTNYGVFYLNAQTVGYSSTQFIDGFVRSNASNIVLPIGKSGPGSVVITGASGGSEPFTDLAYFYHSSSNITQEVGTAMQNSLSAVSQREYWRAETVSTSPKTLKLSYRSTSNISTLVDQLSDLVIAGWNGTQWVQIASTVDPASTFLLGSVSTGALDLSGYKAFTFGSKDGACDIPVTPSGITKTWNGTTWSPSAPTIQDHVVINQPYTGSLNAYSVVLNSDIQVNDNQILDVVDDFSGPGVVKLTSDASLVQRDATALAPKVELVKLTRSLRRYDYVYWGTPIATDFFSQLPAATAVPVGSPTGAFDLKYKYVSGANPGWVALQNIEVGKGFITAVKLQTPFNTPTAINQIKLKITGTANNGDVTVPVVNATTGSNFNLLANPYPGALDVDSFLKSNASVIHGAVYVWASNTINSTFNDETQSFVYSYINADYITYTRAGSVMPSNVALPVFQGKIASAQGFMVQSLANGNVTFTNCMRAKSGNELFYRSASSIASEGRNSYKVNMTGPNNTFSQILVAYQPGLTTGYDNMYDGFRFSSTANRLCSLASTNEKLAINARPEFASEDVVPLGLNFAAANTAGTFTFSLTELEGIFTDDDLKIYVHDLLYDTYHDLKANDFVFVPNQTTLYGRYEIVYVDEAELEVPQPKKNFTTAYLSGGFLQATAGAAMHKIEVFDLMGRLVAQYATDDKTSFTAPFSHSHGLYVIKVYYADGTVYSYKSLHQP